MQIIGEGVTCNEKLFPKALVLAKKEMVAQRPLLETFQKANKDTSNMKTFEK